MSALPFQPRAYTPEDVAALWNCSPDHVRKLVRDKKLPSFRLGGKLIRIKPADVEAFECQNTGSSDSEDLGLSPPMKEESESAVVDLRTLMKRRRARSSPPASQS